MSKTKYSPEFYIFKCTTISCSLEHPPSGRKMEVFTTEPGLQCYTGCNMKPEVFGKGGVEYRKLASVCLETQHYANSVNQASQSKSVQFLHADVNFSF